MNRSGLVVALTTAPPKWMITFASQPDLPLRVRPTIVMFSWIGWCSRCRYCARPRYTECDDGRMIRCESGRPGRVRPDSRKLASRPHCSHSSGRQANPRPG